VDKHEWEEILEKAKKELFNSLDKFGPSEVLGLLVVHSHKDPFAHDLLTRFPTVVSFREFLGALPIVRTDEKSQNDLKGRSRIV